MRHNIISATLSALIAAGFSAASTEALAQPAPDKVFKAPEPKIDRDQFAKSAAAVARADLLSCRNQEATITVPMAVDPVEFAKSLNGVWINMNRRTVHGLPVEEDAAFYIDMKGTTGTGILIDRSNLGAPLLSAPYLQGGRINTTKVKRPMTMTYVNCAFQFWDQYVKVSDTVPVQLLVKTTNLKMPAGRAASADLDTVWKGLVAAKYFEFLDMPTGAQKLNMKRIRPRLGDGSRVAVLVHGAEVSEKLITDGQAPGAEYDLPMLVAGLFKITVRPSQRAGQPKPGIMLSMDAEYRGVGIGLQPGDPVKGVEKGEFLGQGGAAVSGATSSGNAAAPSGGWFVSTRAASGTDTWLTSECGGKNGLVNASTRPQTAPTGHVDHLHESFEFDRVVIGSPY